MKHFNIIPMLNLQLFADGGAAAGGDGGTAQGQGVTAGAASQQTKGASLADVKYGIQPEETAPAAEVQKETAEPADLDAEFEALINGKYKTQYGSRVQGIVRDRFKGKDNQIAELTEKSKAMEPILEMMGKKYGVDASDISALAKALEDDDSYYEAEAMERDMSVSQLKAIKKVERENAQLLRQLKETQDREKADRLHAVWVQQEQVAKQVYPSFNMEAELQNPDFVNLITNNVDVKTAYEVLHRDEIIPAAMQFAAQAVEQNIAKKIAANGVRPSENGMGSQASVVVKNDVSKFTKMDIDEVSRRVARGERVSFG